MLIKINVLVYIQQAIPRISSLSFLILRFTVTSTTTNAQLVCNLFCCLVVLSLKLCLYFFVIIYTVVVIVVVIV